MIRQLDFLAPPAASRHMLESPCATLSAMFRSLENILLSLLQCLQSDPSADHVRKHFTSADIVSRCLPSRPFVVQIFWLNAT